MVWLFWKTVMVCQLLVYGVAILEDWYGVAVAGMVWHYWKTGIWMWYWKTGIYTCWSQCADAVF